MSRSINEVLLLGHLGRDPEVRYTPNGMAVASLSLATSEVRKGKDGKKEEQTEWHRVVLFDKLAEIANEYTAKGAQLLIRGKIATRKYKKEGASIDTYTTEVIGNSMIILSTPKGNGKTPDASDAGDQEVPF